MKSTLYKLTRYEFWPWYLIYLPLSPIYVIGVFYTQRLLYFTAVNPTIDMGGFFGEKKDDILALIPADYIAKTVVIKQGDLTKLDERLVQAGICYPIILKPIVGERGYGVIQVQTKEAIVNYAELHPNFLIQEYVSFDLEISLLFYKMPLSNKLVISSLAEKEYLHVIGDGKSTAEQLIRNSQRKSIYLNLVKQEYAEKLSVIPSHGEKFIIHRIGNHIKGTRFINVNHKISVMLEATIKKLVSNIDGVFYGRFDLKVPSYVELLEGTNYKIFELNGVSSEPTHIYDLSHVFKAYYCLAHHWITIIKISKQNIKKGVKTTPFNYFFTQVKNHFG